MFERGELFFEFFLTGVIGNERMSEEDKKREVETANAFTIHWRTQALLNDVTLSPHKVVCIIKTKTPKQEKAGREKDIGLNWVVTQDASICPCLLLLWPHPRFFFLPFPISFFSLTILDHPMFPQ